MSKRLRAYYPDSMTEKGLYTNGREYITEDMIEYVGFYHKYTSGEVFTLYEYNSLLSKKLIPYAERHKLETIEQSDPNNYVLPSKTITYPSIEDYSDRKIWYRYFIRKVNDASWGVREINEDQYESTNTDIAGTINGFLFKTIKLPWKLNGILNDITRNGIRNPGIYETNLRTIEYYSKDFPGLENTLTNPLEFTKYSNYYNFLTRQ